jgi:uncharacterized protein YndB with AHSA1/START domain
MTLDDGTLTIHGDVAVISFERTLAHPIDVVWAALTDPAQLAQWLGPGAIEARTGGSVSIAAGPPDRQLSISGRVLTWEPPHVLEHEWLQAGLEVSVVRYELDPAGDGTLLRLTHHRSVGTGTGGRAGWHAYLDRLLALLDGEPIPAWLERRAAVEQAYGEPPIGR